MTQNKFNFFVGADIEEDIFKAAKSAKGDKKYDNMIVYGLASDNSKDLQGEVLEPAGYETEEFLKSGLLNLEHYTARKGDPSYWIGEPLGAEVKGNEFFIKGKLWKDHPMARNFWDTLLIMKSSGSTRRPGFSIEGKKLEVDPKNKKRITKARIKHCAVTMSPVNANSWLDIAKGQQQADYIEAFTKEEVEGKTYILQLEKDGNIITVNKDYTVSIKPKSMGTGDIEPLTKESLKKQILRLESWDTIMKAIKEGLLPKEKIGDLIKNITKNFKIG